jgi:hypothetical protein
LPGDEERGKRYHHQHDRHECEAGFYG